MINEEMFQLNYYAYLSALKNSISAKQKNLNVSILSNSNKLKNWFIVLFYFLQNLTFFKIVIEGINKLIRFNVLNHQYSKSSLFVDLIEGINNIIRFNVLNHLYSKSSMSVDLDYYDEFRYSLISYRPSDRMH